MKIFLPISLFCFLSIFMLAGFHTADRATKRTASQTVLTLVFDNVVGDQELTLHRENYTNEAGESFTLSQLQYFVSNIKFGKTDGTEYVVPQEESYFLVQENDPRTQVLHLKVPEGDYNKLSFILGVDSIRNTMDIGSRTGVLDPANSMDNGMYWGWNSGYIFFKMEGNSEAAPEDPTGRRKFRYHIGGFGGYSAPTINNIKMISLDLSQGIARQQKGQESRVVIKSDILKVFSGKNNVSIAAHPSVMFSEYSVIIANNYCNMFTHHRTEN